MPRRLRPPSSGHRPAQPAQALVELALVLPVLLLMLVGMIDLGRAFVYGVAVQDGAREAARLGARAAMDTTVDDKAVRARLIAASAPALAGCSETSSTCNLGAGGTWTFSLSIRTKDDGSTYSSLNAVPLSKRPGATLTVTARGSSVSLLAGVVTGIGLRLNPITVQGQAVMVVL